MHAGAPEVDAVGTAWRCTGTLVVVAAVCWIGSDPQAADRLA
jgi:hypothetical protein